MCTARLCSRSLIHHCYLPQVSRVHGTPVQSLIHHYCLPQVSRVHGTRPYIPEEYLRDKKLSTKVDCYSYGVVLFELCTGLRAFDDKRHHKFLVSEKLQTVNMNIQF